MNLSHYLFLGALFACTMAAVADEPPDVNPAESLYRITGRVVDEAERPVAEAKVESLSQWQRASTTTDEDGRFVLRVMHRYEPLIVRATDAEGARHAFSGFAFDEQEKTMLSRFLPEGKFELPEQLRLVVRPAKKIEVVVVDGEQRPVADAQVFLMATWDVKLTETTTDGEGKAALMIPVDAPRYAIVAMKPKAGFDYMLYQSPTAEREKRYRLPRGEQGPVTFVLNGAPHVTLKLVDEDGQPVPNVKVAPGTIEKPRKGSGHRGDNLYDTGVLFTSSLADFSATSNAEGEAIFDYFSADAGRIWLRDMAFGRYSGREDQVGIEPGNGDAEVTMTLVRQMPLEAQVTYNDGRPAPGIFIFVLHHALDDARDTPAPKSGNYATQTDDQGVARLHVFANDIQLIRAWRDKWAAPLTTHMTLDEPPGEPLRIVLQPATRLHGRLRMGPRQVPLANQSLGVARHAEESYRLLTDAGLALKPMAKGRPAPTVDLWLLHESSGTTNERGEFEFFLGPGKYQLSYAQEPPVEVELDGQAELEVDLHAERASQVEFEGRVVYQDREREGVAGATVVAYYLTDKEHFPSGKAVTDATGAFRFTRPPVEMLLYARDEEGKFAGSSRAMADDRSAVISVQPAASAHGRLIDATTLEPVRNVRVEYGVEWEGPRTLQECGGSARTDEHGEFTTAGMLTSQRYHFTLIRGTFFPRLLTVTPRQAGDIELGTYRVDLTSTADPAKTGPVAAADAPKLFDTEIAGDELLADALKQAKIEQKRVLLVFGANWSAWCHRLNGCFEENKEIAKRLREGYVIAWIDLDRPEASRNTRLFGQNYGMQRARRRGSRTDHVRLPALVLLDADGKRIAAEVGSNLEDEDRYQAEKILQFLNH